ncbi:MAG: DUF1929 domain-containing protein [Akkermansiaceae bacterium]|nr:DUF1929 domain-containing protein [Akkermansiaceae bacterium]
MALSMVSMVRLGSATHSANTDQRRLELCGPAAGACGGATKTVTVPGAGIAIPGKWMVFGINGAGVVSVSKILTGHISAFAHLTWGLEAGIATSLDSSFVLFIRREFGLGCRGMARRMCREVK